MNQTHSNKAPRLIYLILFISFPSVVAVLLSPALPEISHSFLISAGHAQQLITLFVLGYALGQLLYSPVANRFGRKPASYLGIGLYLVSALICLVGIHLHSFPSILLGRFLMSLGAAVGMIISFTIINDYYEPSKSRVIVSHVVLAYAFMPALAVLAGGLITSHISWAACFYFYLIYGAFMLIIIARLPETLNKKKQDALNIKRILKSYKQAFSSKRLISFSLIYGLMSAFIYITASAAPFIGIHDLGLTPATYSLFLLIPYSGQLLGALISGKINRHLSAHQVARIGYACTVIGTLWMFVCFLLNDVTLLSLIAPLFVIMVGLPMSYSAASVMALTTYKDKATGSAVMTFITMFTAVLFTFVLAILRTHRAIIMPSLFLVLIVLVLAILMYTSKRFVD